MIFRCSKDFAKEDGTLKVLELNDLIMFGNLEYQVWSFTLFRVYAKDPEKVFKLLLIFNKEKYCKKHYHYNPSCGYGFPHFNQDDYEAITRVSFALMKRWEKWRWCFRSIKKLKRWCG